MLNLRSTAAIWLVDPAVGVMEQLGFGAAGRPPSPIGTQGNEAVMGTSDGVLRWVRVDE